MAGLVTTVSDAEAIRRAQARVDWEAEAGGPLAPHGGKRVVGVILQDHYKFEFTFDDGTAAIGFGAPWISVARGEAPAP